MLQMKRNKVIWKRDCGHLSEEGISKCYTNSSPFEMTNLKQPRKGQYEKKEIW